MTHAQSFDKNLGEKRILRSLVQTKVERPEDNIVVYNVSKQINIIFTSTLILDKNITKFYLR